MNRRLGNLLLLLAATGCTPPLDPAEGPSPREGEVVAHTFFPDIPHDTWNRTRLDLYRPRRDTPAPTVIHAHAGGFVEGDEDQLATQRDYVPTLLAEGIAVASVTCRLLDEQDPDGVEKPMGEVQRAAQFLRHHAEAMVRAAEDAGADVIGLVPTRDMLTAEGTDRLS